MALAKVLLARAAGITAACASTVAGVSSQPQTAAPTMFPGKHFISTVLELLDNKTAMTGSIAQRYLMRAAMAGIIVGVFYLTYFAVVAAFSHVPAGAGGEATWAPLGKFLGSLVFGWALVFIYYSKSELLTSNMMIVTIGVYYRRTTVGKGLKLLGLCFLGNVLGGLLIAVIVVGTTIINDDLTTAMAGTLDHKLGYLGEGLPGLLDLFLRAVLCNFMINLAMLLVYNGNIHSDVLKAMVMVMAVFVFAFVGLEHSVANSVLFVIEAMHHGIDGAAALTNVAIALLGNFVGGGILIGLYYAYVNDEGRYLRHEAAKADRSTS